ncbi:MAG: type II toxin-antitoxin system RelE family toxin [Candidatus Limnocylindria bacterium]
MYAVELLPSAAKQLEVLDRSIQRRVARKIEQLAGEPRGPGSVKLRGAEDIWRLRVGDYRILYRIEDARLIVLVIRIGHRRDVYRAGAQ